MYSYHVFGGYLRSELEFPELRASGATMADWTLRISQSAVRRRGAELLGSAGESGCQIELYRQADHLLLYHSCTGSFEIRNSGRIIVWNPTPGVRMEAARADVFGRVLAVAMHVQGILTVHASAVALEDGAVAFLAPKHYGKSTLAMALTAAGGRLVTDDMLPISPDSVPTVMPGVQTLRLLEDSATKLCQDNMSVRIGIDGKRVVRPDNPDNLLSDRTPLSAIYVLSPMSNLPDGTSASRTRLSSVPAAISLVGHMKVGALLGPTAAAMLVARAGSIVEKVPVYRLQVVRDIERLDQVVETIFDWHQASVTAGS